MARRITSAILFAAITLPLWVAVLFTDPGSKLPACCRRDGKHHCAMMDMASQGADGGTAFRDASCPYSHSARFFASREPLVAKTQQSEQRIVISGASAAAGPRLGRFSLISFHSKRGPPANSNL
jgi:hypothetical protein